MKIRLLVISLVLAASIFVPTIPQSTNLSASPVVQTQTRASDDDGLRHIAVGSQAITSLARGKNYVVDLTKRGVVYEFDNKDGQLDLSRVFVRTSKGEVAMTAYLEKAIPKAKLANLKISSQAFTVGTRPTANVATPRAAALNFGCDRAVCSCSGRKDCGDLIFGTSLCGDLIICTTQSNGQKFCICART
jgi:hypothetical protein